MIRLWQLLAWTMTFCSTQGLADSTSANQLSGLISFRSIDASGYAGWDTGGAGKLIARDADARLHGIFDYRARLTDTVQFDISVVAQDPDFGRSTGVTEFFLSWKPVPSGAVRHRFQLGVFYPPVSLDNNSVGWTGDSTNNFSAINTWIAEEVRVAGFESRHGFKFDWFDRAQRLNVTGAVFMNNDSAGALIAWKGWSLHERQTRWDDQLAIPEIGVLQPGQVFEDQANFIDPYREVDDKPGYYLGLDWRTGRSSLLNVLYYDNRADPTVIIDGQYGWHTRFTAIGLASNVFDLRFKAQWMTGRTEMGKAVDGRSLVDNEFQASYVQLSKKCSAHRVTLRRDWFSVDDRDFLSEDPNGETGNAWTLSYRRDSGTALDYSLEWLRIETDREAWRQLGESPQTIERQVLGKIILEF